MATAKSGPLPGLNRTQAVTLGLVFVGGIAATIAAGWIMNAYRGKNKILSDAHNGFDGGIL